MTLGAVSNNDYELFYRPTEETDELRECPQWQLSAFVVTLAWINLLFNMRLLHGIGKYIILFQVVIFTFCAIAIVFVIMVTGFAFSFHLLLSNRQEFQSPYDSMLKTFLMMSGIYIIIYYQIMVFFIRSVFHGYDLRRNRLQ